MKRFILLIYVFCLLLQTQAFAKIAMPVTFGDGMVLQREMPVRIFGEAPEGASVTVRLNGQQQTTVSHNGNWMVLLEAMPAGCPYELFVSGDGEKLIFKDVMLGEVWVAGGQSNMAQALLCHIDFENYLPVEENPELRFIHIPVTEFGEIDRAGVAWNYFDQESDKTFSAVAFFFATECQKRLGVTVGMIGSYRGGTWNENWMTPESIKNEPEIEYLFENYDKEYAKFKDEAAYEEEFLGGWQAAVLPTSVAQLTGKRLVMCETGDFLQTLSGDDPATLQEMQTSTAWQMAWGVTEFALYYRISYGKEFPFRSESTHRDYCDFVGRINSIVREAKPEKSTLLYYPIFDMQQEYQPTASPAGFKTQNEKVEQIENSFNQLGISLSTSQIPFVLVDYLFLKKATITSKGTISIGANEYSSLVIPQGVILPPEIEVLVEKMKENGIEVLEADHNQSVDEFVALLNPLEKIVPERNDIAFGKFSRSGHDIHLLVNSGTEVYSGQLTVQQKGNWSVMDPQTGGITQIKSTTIKNRNAIPVDLRPNQTLIFVSK